MRSKVVVPLRELLARHGTRDRIAEQNARTSTWSRLLNALASVSALYGRSEPYGYSSIYERVSL
jgi:predicted RNA-binding Zn ribbon-like protein